MPVSIAKRLLPKELLVQMLEQPGIVEAVQALEPAALHRWITHVGLEDAEDLVLLASSAQLLSVLDLDVWRSEQAGVDETFDAERFALWVEVLLESGVRGAVRKIAELDEDLLTLALCRHTFVIDVEGLALRMSSGRYDEDEEGDADLLLKELEGALSQEFEQFCVIARSARSWEPIRILLVELDAAVPELFVRLLERCAHISLEYIADNGGLYEVLSSGEMVDTDVAAEREERRTRQGYVAPSAARAFLVHARTEPLCDLLASEGTDPITHAHFRDASPPSAARRKTATDTPVVSRHNTKARELLETLQAAQVIPSRSAPPLLSAGSEADAGRDPLIACAVRELLPSDARAHAARVDELAYLANVVLAGCSTHGDELRATDAARATLEICDLGAASLFAKTRPAKRCQALAEWLRDHSVVKLFRIGWNERASRASRQQSDSEVVRSLVAELPGTPAGKRARSHSRLSPSRVVR